MPRKKMIKRGELPLWCPVADVFTPASSRKSREVGGKVPVTCVLNPSEAVR